MKIISPRWSLALLLIIPTCWCRSLPAQTAGNSLQEERARTEAGEITGTVLDSQYSRMAIPILEGAVDPDSYVLGPYDRLLVNLVGPFPRSFSLVVLPEGEVFIPDMGAIRADGLTLTEFREELSREVDKRFHDIELYCFLQQPRVFRVFVTGEVERPGPVSVTAMQRISDAIALAGGIRAVGTNRRVCLERNGDKNEVDILKFNLQGDFSSNPFLSNGDRIHVPVAQKHAAVFGSVRKSALYQVLPRETVADLLELAGGFSPQAVRDSILLSRIDEEGSVSTTTLIPEDFDLVLRDGDEICVINEMSNTHRIYIFGAVSRSGYLYITEGERLTSVLGRVGDFGADADFSGASIERKNGEILRINLGDYVPPRSGKDIRLRDGDMLHVPRLNQVVVVGGEVMVPGKFGFNGDWTVAQYVGLAGGPTDKGSIDRVVIYSTDGKSRKADKNSRPNRGDTIIVKKSKTTIFGSVISSAIQLGMVAISIIVLTK
ncbi:MAG: SLBB domain-containing protein [Candidatus Krumholzibacteriota bacterium]|nr:SLBB domain-containing protein [Candidatus Krumholzibacteriota bacterium]